MVAMTLTRNVFWLLQTILNGQPFKFDLEKGKETREEDYIFEML